MAADLVEVVEVGRLVKEVAAVVVAGHSKAGLGEGSRSEVDKTVQNSVRLWLLNWDQGIDETRLRPWRKAVHLQQALLEDGLPQNWTKARRFVVEVGRQDGIHSSGDVSDSHCLGVFLGAEEHLSHRILVEVDSPEEA